MIGPAAWASVLLAPAAPPHQVAANCARRDVQAPCRGRHATSAARPGRSIQTRFRSGSVRRASSFLLVKEPEHGPAQQYSDGRAGQELLHNRKAEEPPVLPDGHDIAQNQQRQQQSEGVLEPRKCGKVDPATGRSSERS